MGTNLESKDLEQLLAEADELIEQINSDAIEYMKDEHLLQFATHTQNLDKIKAKAQGKVGDTGEWDIESSAEGMYEAAQEIVRAMQDLRERFLSLQRNTLESPFKNSQSIN